MSPFERRALSIATILELYEARVRRPRDEFRLQFARLAIRIYPAVWGKRGIEQDAYTLAGVPDPEAKKKKQGFMGQGFAGMSAAQIVAELERRDRMKRAKQAE